MSKSCVIARARKVHACTLRKKFLICLFNLNNLSLHEIDEISWKNWIPISGGCAMARARKVHVRCMRARLEKNSRFVFSTNIVCLYMEYTRLVEIIEFQCQGAVQWPVHARCPRACTHKGCLMVERVLTRSKWPKKCHLVFLIFLIWATVTEISVKNGFTL